MPVRDETTKFDKDALKAHILFKLARHRRWGGKHTELMHVRSALPKGYESMAESLAKELANEGMLTWLKKTNDVHVSLNPHRKKSIIELVERYFGKQIW